MSIMHITTRPLPILRITLLSVFGLVILFSQSRSAFAQWATNGNNINNTNTGNVGVGTTAPNRAKLEINQASVFNMAGGLEINAAGVDTGLAMGADATNNIGWIQSLEPGVSFTTRPLALQPNGGNVGIGTTNPTRPLEVLASNGEAARLYRNANNVGWGVNMVFAFNNSSGAKIDYAGLHGVIGTNTAGAEGGNLVFTTTTSGSLTEKMRIDPLGNVGIGTTAPLAFASGNLGSGRFTHISSSGVTGLALTGTFPELLLYDSDGAANNRIFQIMQDAGLAKIRVVNDAISALTLDNVQVWNLSTGNVGIGTNAPANKLHVAGSITVDGNINAKYQDVAEWVPATRMLAPGTVVTLNPTKSNLVEASSKAYDTRVAGVVSAQPGIALGERGENKVLVATTGRVKVKADATKAPINIGDLLVTSDTSGMAMKSEPITIGGRQIHSPGTLIGKALEPLANGCGEILVLLSLQ